MKKRTPPFHKSVLHQMKEFGIALPEALLRVQERYDGFKKRTDTNLNRQIQYSNNAQLSLIGHMTALATLTITASGFLAGQFAEKFTVSHKKLFLAVLSLEVIALILSVIDYFQTINFHNKWALTYKDIDEEVEEKVASGGIVMVNDLGQIEAKHTAKQKASTNKKITLFMILTCLAGLSSLVLLFYAFFFDVPGNW